ncbi:MAG: cation:proton antiporter [Chloroflexota bacterium]
MDLLLALGLILVLGLMGGLVSRRLNLPTITGYIVVGLIVGPTVTGIIDAGAVQALEAITGISLGVIAYLIGTNLQIATVRSLGKSIASITFFEAVTAFAAVAVVLAFVTERFLPGFTLEKTYIPFALVMAAAACATAPAAVLAIVRESRAKGPLTSTLLAVVALDDAVAVVLFSGALAVALALAGTMNGMPLGMVLVVPVLHIVEAIAIGGGLALAASQLARLIRTRELMVVLVLGIVVLSYGICNVLGVSGIMANMALGFVIGNRRSANKMVSALGDIEPVLYAMFFVIAGLHFDSTTFASAAPLAAVIVAVWCAGKYAGTRFGAWVGGAEPQVGRYLGVALLPEAGVSIGLALIAAQQFPQVGAAMVSATLASVIINELITPPLLRSALVKAGEVRREAPKETVQGAGSEETKGSRDGTVPPVERVAVRTSDPHILEGPWARSQRARSGTLGDRGTGLTHPRPHL